MQSSDGLAMVHPADRAAWRDWLAAHHATSPGVWLVFDKKSAGRARLAYEAAVEEALCFGWIDSRANTIDAQRYRQLFSPRKPASNWSRSNKERVERLAAAGLMTPAGLAAVEAAKANGAWTALDAVEELHEPGDLRSALDGRPDARRHWDGFPRSARRAILQWIGAAKTAETRARRVAETAGLAAQNIRANQSRQPKER